MAFSLTCPKCSAKMKTVTAIPIGRSVQCPKCKKGFQVSNDTMEKVADTKPSIPPAAGKAVPAANPVAPKPAAAPAPKPAAAPAPKPAAAPAPKPAATFVLKSAPTVAAAVKKAAPPPVRTGESKDQQIPLRESAEKRRDEDDDRAYTIVGDDDQENEARSRKRADDGDGPRRRADDSEEQNQPRRAKKKKKPKKANIRKLLYLAGAGGLVALAGIIVLCIWLFGGGVDSEMLAFMPAETWTLEYEDVEEFSANPKFRTKLEAAFQSALCYGPFTAGGIGVDDIAKMLEARTQTGQVITAFRLKKPVDMENAIQGGTETKVGDASYWTVKNGNSGDVYLSFPGKRLVLVGSSDKVMTAALDNAEGKVVVPKEMQELIKRVADGDHWEVFSEVPTGEITDANILSVLRNAKGGAVQINIGSSSLRMTKFVQCETHTAASKLFEYYKKKQEDMKKYRIDQYINPKGLKLTDAQKDVLKQMLLSRGIDKDEAYLIRSQYLDLEPFDELDDRTIPGL